MGRTGRPRNTSFHAYKCEQGRIAQRRLYPLTAFYSLYSVSVLILALRTAHPLLALSFYFAGIPVWTLVEYLFHRFVLHGRFPPGEGFIRQFLHERLDPLHWEHHEHPFDGLHISGELKDLLPLFFLAAPASFLFPVYTLPALLAGVVQSYVAEEWIHYSLHFHNSRNPLFRRIKRYHLYHHSPRGMKMGMALLAAFGIKSSGPLSRGRFSIRFLDGNAFEGEAAKSRFLKTASP
jgi:hypothetical protein